MRKKGSISQTVINEISEFLIQEFLEYYPFNSYQFLLESLNELNLSSTNFEYTVNMLEITSDSDEKLIQNSLWIATIKQRLLIKLQELQIGREEFKTVLLTIKSNSDFKEKSIICRVKFTDFSNKSYKGGPITKTIKRSKTKLINSVWLSKMKRFLHS